MVGWLLRLWRSPVRTVLAHSPWLQTSKLIGGFDNELGYTYQSQVANVELNQRLKLFAVDPYRGVFLAVGLSIFLSVRRFLADRIRHQLSGVRNAPLADEEHLLGGQLGLQWTWGWDRVQFTTEVKGGLFANVYSQHGTDSATGTAAVVPFDVSRSDTDLAALFELSLLLRCRVTSCMWVRAGYQYYCATGLALGPRQLGGYDSSGTVGFDGLSVGVEATW